MKFVDDVDIISDTVLEVETVKGLFNELVEQKWNAKWFRFSSTAE